MTKRKRKRMAERKQTEPHYEQVPVEKLNELRAEHGIDNYKLKLCRRTEAGHVKSIGTVMLTYEEMLDLETKLQSLSGGGSYNITAFAANDMSKKLFGINLLLDGPPKMTSHERGVMHRTGLAAGAATVVSQIQQHEAMAARHGDVPAWQRDFTAPAASFSSDEIALQQVTEERRQKMELEKRLAAMEEKYAEERREREARDERERQNRERERAEAKEKEHALELKRLEDRIAALAATPKGPNIGDIIAGMAPFVPVFTALVSTRNAGAALEAEKQNKMLELQMTNTNKIMEMIAGGKQDSTKSLMETLKIAGPILAPILTAMINNNGPKAQAELMSAQSELNSHTLGMVSQLIEQAAGGSEEIPVGLQIADKLVQGAYAVAEAIRRQQTQTGPMQQVAQVAQQLAVQAQSAPTQQVNGHHRGGSVGEQIADQVLAHPMVPQEMKTAEWHLLLTLVHDKADADKVALQLAHHIWNLDGEKKLPKFLEKVFETPEDVLKQLFSPLPIWQEDQLYAKSVITKTISILENPPEEDSEEPDGDPGETEETADETAS